MLKSFLCLQGKQESSSTVTEGSSQAAAGGEIDRAVQLSCGEHTDYGLLTLVNQDPDIPALQVSSAFAKPAFRVLPMLLHCTHMCCLREKQINYYSLCPPP